MAMSDKRSNIPVQCLWEVSSPDQMLARDILRKMVTRIPGQVVGHFAA
jgi:hypothetical protein